MSIKKRAKQAFDLKYYNQANYPEEVGELNLTCPFDNQYVLRCLVKKHFGDYLVPDFLEWTKPLLNISIKRQEEMDIRQPFCYITVRHGIVESVTDDEWHVDGISFNFTQLPDQNYLYSSSFPTEISILKTRFPKDFDPMRHNIMLYLDNEIKNGKSLELYDLESHKVYCLDSYVVHRRPPESKNCFRTFVKISFCPIEICDVANQCNPLIPTSYTRNGVAEFRDKLVDYYQPKDR